MYHTELLLVHSVMSVRREFVSLNANACVRFVVAALRQNNGSCNELVCLVATSAACNEFKMKTHHSSGGDVRWKFSMRIS